MNIVILEHLVMCAQSPSELRLAASITRLPALADPVTVAESMHPRAITHSSSWRWTRDGVILTFVHVYPDATLGADAKGRIINTSDIEFEPVACHAIRHMYFLEKTDTSFSVHLGFSDFWEYSAEIARHHHPAVAGFFDDDFEI